MELICEGQPYWDTMNGDQDIFNIFDLINSRNNTVAE